MKLFGYAGTLFIIAVHPWVFLSLLEVLITSLQEQEEGSGREQKVEATRRQQMLGLSVLQSH